LPLRQDALQQPVGRLVLAALGARQLSLGGHQPPLAGRLQYGCSIALQFPLNPLQPRDRRIKPRELLLDRLDDAALLICGSKRDRERTELGQIDGLNRPGFPGGSGV
jgi:hypothetical protein